MSAKPVFMSEENAARLSRMIRGAERETETSLGVAGRTNVVSPRSWLYKITDNAPVYAGSDSIPFYHAIPLDFNSDETSSDSFRLTDDTTTLKGWVASEKCTLRGGDHVLATIVGTGDPSGGTDTIGFIAVLCPAQTGLWGKVTAQDAIAPASVTNISLTGNVVTLTCVDTVEFTTGQSVVVSGLANSDLNGTYTLTGASGSGLTYALTHADISSIADSGQVDIATQGTFACAWTEYAADQDGTMVPVIGGRSGTMTPTYPGTFAATNPAFDVNRNILRPLPTYVWLEPGYKHLSTDSIGVSGTEYVYWTHPGKGGSGHSNSLGIGDNTSNINGVTSVTLNGLVATDDGGGHMTINPPVDDNGVLFRRDSGDTQDPEGFGTSPNLRYKSLSGELIVQQVSTTTNAHHAVSISSDSFSTTSLIHLVPSPPNYNIDLEIGGQDFGITVSVANTSNQTHSTANLCPDSQTGGGFSSSSIGATYSTSVDLCLGTLTALRAIQNGVTVRLACDLLDGFNQKGVYVSSGGQFAALFGADTLGTFGVSTNLGVRYIVSIPSDWAGTPPVDMADALDRIAAALFSIGAPP